MLCSFDGGGIMSSRRYDDIVMTSIWRVTEICFYFTKKIAIFVERHCKNENSIELYQLNWYILFSLQWIYIYI